jgi:hypothetical protein
MLDRKNVFDIDYCLEYLSRSIIVVHFLRTGYELANCSSFLAFFISDYEGFLLADSFFILLEVVFDVGI